MCVSAAPTTVPATTTVEDAAATAMGKRERRTSPGNVASPTPVEMSPAKNAPIPEGNCCPLRPWTQ
jgi:hypothetical protein